MLWLKNRVGRVSADTLGYPAAVEQFPELVNKSTVPPMGGVAGSLAPRNQLDSLVAHSPAPCP